MHLSSPIRLIRTFPFGRRITLRLYNRFLMHFSPRKVVKTYFGAELECDVRDMIQATIIHFGVWEPRVSQALESLIKPGDTIVDVGANIGYYSALFAKVTGPTGHVVAIEALPKLAEVVARTARRNGFENIRTVNVAVSDRSGKVVLYEAPSTNIGMTTMREDRGFPASAVINALPLTEILTKTELTNVSLIKIDIEGAEIPVVRHFLDHLDQFPRRPAIAVEASIAENPDWAPLFERFLALGYQAYDLDNDYDWQSIMAGQIKIPTLLTALPPVQTDILFTPIPL